MKEILTPFNKLLRLLYSDKKEIGFIYLYGFLGGLVSLTLPLGIQAIINLIGGNQISNAWIILVIIVVIGIMISSVMQVMQLYIAENIQQKLFVRTAFEFAFRIPKMDFKVLKGRYPPEIINRFFDVLTVQKGIPKILIDFSTSLFQIIFGIILLSVYHPFFIFFGFVLILILFVIFRYSFPLGMKTSILESKFKYKTAYWLEEVARTIETFKLVGKNDYPEVKTNGIVKEYVKYRKEHFKILVFQFFNLILFKLIIATGLLLIGGFLVFQQQMNIGQFVAAEIIILLIINSTEKIILGIETIYDVLTGIEKMSEVVKIDLEEEKGIELDENLKALSVKINDLTFYNELKQKKILDKINTEIKKGEKIVITGYPLSGKTAFLQVITALFTEFEGSIHYNGISVNNINIFHLRKHIGDNLIKEDIFNASLLENLIFGKNIDIDTVQEAIDIVGLNDFVSSLPEGYKTELMGGGYGLSKQEIVKIKIARCIVCRPALVLIEETIDLLEDEDKFRILDFIQRQEFTCIISTHDKRVAEKFGRVVVFDKGRIVSDAAYNDVKDQEGISYILR
jgi:ABC-type bacteriocin/lantibiotic exporter with double-glycine peptidase domain